MPRRRAKRRVIILVCLLVITSAGAYAFNRCFEKDLKVNLPAAVSVSNAAKEIHLPSIDCESAGRLDVMFFGGMRDAQRHDYGEFYSVMASLQRNS